MQRQKVREGKKKEGIKMTRVKSREEFRGEWKE